MTKCVYAFIIKIYTLELGNLISELSLLFGWPFFLFVMACPSKFVYSNEFFGFVAYC